MSGTPVARAQAVSKVETALRQAIAQGGEGAEVARYNLAQWLWRAGRHAEAVELARESLRLAPAGPYVKEVRAVLAAQDAVWQWVFEPARRGEEPVVEIRLRPNEEPPGR